MPTIQEAVSAIYGQVDAVCGNIPNFLIIWPNKSSSVDPVKQENPWMYVTLNHSTGKQISLAGCDGKSLWSRFGKLRCEIYTKTGIGIDKPYDLAKTIEKGFLAKDIDGVRFRAISINESGIHGNWFLIIVTVSFEYDELI